MRKGLEFKYIFVLFFPWNLTELTSATCFGWHYLVFFYFACSAREIWSQTRCWQHTGTDTHIHSHSYTPTHTQSHEHTHTNTDRHRQEHRHTHREKHKHKHKYIHTLTHIHPHIYTETNTNTHTYTQTHTLRHTHTRTRRMADGTWKFLTSYLLCELKFGKMQPSFGKTLSFSAKKECTKMRGNHRKKSTQKSKNCGEKFLPLN